MTMELCSLTFQAGDFSKSNLVAASLFADGATAVLLRSPQHRSCHLANSGLIRLPADHQQGCAYHLQTGGLGQTP